VTFPCQHLEKVAQKANTPRVSGPQRALTGPTCKEVEMAEKRVCAIEGCCKPVKARGWCSAHYAMWKKYGDPLARKAVPYGLPLSWLKAHVCHKDEACLIWPFGGNGNGYGQVRFEGVSRYPHRIMCQMAHGEAPSRAHQAAHSCGNRECVNPKHLRWLDQSGNEIDKAAHGRDLRGEKHFNAKLTAADVRQIRSLEGASTHEEIAARFGISSVHVHRICRHQRWGWLE
jgi:hypothetical protein